MYHICAKECLDSNFYLAVIDKIPIIYKIAPYFIFTHKNRNFNSLIEKKWTNCFYRIYPIKGFHVTSQQPNCASHAIHSRHVGSFFALSSIGKSHKICSHSLLLNLHKAKLHRSNNVINIYSLTAGLTCSNKISKKLKHILLFFGGGVPIAPRKKHRTWHRQEVRTGCVPLRENHLYNTLYNRDMYRNLHFQFWQLWEIKATVMHFTKLLHSAW